MKTITINNKEYKIKYTLRALFIFERITNKAFEIKTLLDNYIFFYSMILANNEEIIDWDEFINALDENPNILTQMSDLINEQEKKDNLFAIDDNTETNKKK